MNFMPGVLVRPGAVRLGGIELACDIDGLPAGTGLTLAIRPEDIRVQGVTGSEENAVTLHIKAMEFLGAFFRVDLEETPSMASRSGRTSRSISSGA